jgi:hypothetical protein
MEEELYEIRCKGCNLHMFDSIIDEGEVYCSECAGKMSKAEIDSKNILWEYPTFCKVCNKKLDFEKIPKRKDIELCYQDYAGESKGISFCSEECFKKYVKDLLEETEIGPNEEREELKECDICKENVKEFPEYNLIYYDEDNPIEKVFCSDKCMRKYLIKINN